MKTLRHMWFIAAKELKLFVTDRMALVSFLLFPFLFVALFSFVLGDVGSEDSRMELHLVAQEDTDGLGYKIVKAMETEDEAELDPGELIVIRDEDYEEAYRSVADGKYGGFLAFPEDFTDGISLGYGSSIEVVSDPDATYSRAALNSIAEAIAAQIGLQQVVRGAITGLMMEGWLESGDAARIGEEIPELLSVQGSVPMRSSVIEYEVEEVGQGEA